MMKKNDNYSKELKIWNFRSKHYLRNLYNMNKKWPNLKFKEKRYSQILEMQILQLDNCSQKLLIYKFPIKLDSQHKMK